MSLCDCRQGRDPCTCKPATSFHARVKPWMMECFGLAISADRQERNHRFLEEALELVQAYGATASEAHQLVDYVYGRPSGDPVQEVGGVMVTLAALCLANGMDMHAAGETELARIWTKVEQIRAKQASKPAMSPLPGVYPERTAKAASSERIKGMIELVGGEYAIMIDPENGHFGWIFRRHPDGQWVSVRVATEPEMYVARQHAVHTGQGI